MAFWNLFSPHNVGMNSKKTNIRKQANMVSLCLTGILAMKCCALSCMGTPYNPPAIPVSHTCILIISSFTNMISKYPWKYRLHLFQTPSKDQHVSYAAMVFDQRYDLMVSIHGINKLIISLLNIPLNVTNNSRKNTNHS